MEGRPRVSERTDEIRLTGLAVTGYHGVYDHERRDGQTFVVDATIGVDTAAAARTDDITQTVHYGQLAESLAAIVAGEPCDLIETLAHRLLDATFEHERVQWAEITVHKPQAPIPLQFADVAVTVRRSRR